MENKKQQTNEDTERRQHNTSDKPGNGNGRTAEGRDRIYAPCNNSEEGLRCTVGVVTLFRVVARTHTHTHRTHMLTNMPPRHLAAPRRRPLSVTP